MKLKREQIVWLAVPCPRGGECSENSWAADTVQAMSLNSENANGKWGEGHWYEA